MNTIHRLAAVASCVFIIGLSTLIGRPAVLSAGFIYGYLHQPEYEVCGDVSIDGIVAWNNPNDKVTGFSWDWGDGTLVNSWLPSSHHYQKNGSYTVNVTAFLSTGETLSISTTVTITNAEDPLCNYAVLVYPFTVVLREGKTSETLHIDARDSNGAPLSVSDRTVNYTSSNPALIQVDLSGVVRGTGFGEAQIEVTVQGLPRKAKVLVVAGEFRVEPPILLLSPAGQSTGQLTLHLANADGSQLDLAGHSLIFQGSNSVASVDGSGFVTAIHPPQVFTETPYITALLDRKLSSHNASIIRVTASPLGLTLQDSPGEHTTIRAANQVGPNPFSQLIEALQAVQVTDAIYLVEQYLTDVTPFKGDTLFLVMDPGFDSDGTVPCGLSGNPVRLGVAVDTFKSCFGGTDYLQWGVIAHEMGHDFMSIGGQPSFNSLIGGLPNATTYNEGIATMLGAYSLDELLNNPVQYGLTDATIANLMRSAIPGTPSFDRNIFYNELTTYEGHPDYASAFNADLLDAIMLKLHDEFGKDFFFRFMSAFVPADEPLPITFSSEGQRLAFWVAACSAAAKADLKPRFRDKWGFPIDEAFYDQIYPQAEKLVARRDPLFTISVNPSSERVPAGSSANFTINIQSAFGYTQPISLTAEVMPNDGTVTTTLSSDTVTPGNSTTLTVSTMSNTPQSLFAIDVSATSTGIVWTAAETVSVMITAPETVSSPDTPSGSTNGKSGISYTYTTKGSLSSLGHTVEYQFDWKGDSSDLSPWGPAKQSRTWVVAGAYNVRTRARCVTDTGVVSSWSNPLFVNISVPDISVNPMTYDFGNVKMKRNKTASFNVKNKGTVDLLILPSVMGPDASMFIIGSGGGSKTINPGKSLTVKVAFKPMSAGLNQGTLRITSNDPDTPTVDIPLTGRCQ